MLVLHTLGELRLGGGWTAKLSSPRIALTLLAYLARRSPRSVSRGELADLFWRERDAARARQSLRQVLLELKRIIGDGLVTDSDRVFLAPGALALDVDGFESDVAAGRWQEAVGGWRGEFLASADNLGGEDFRLWLEAERESLHRGLRVTVRGLIERGRANGNWREGIAWAQRWIELLPLEEEGHQHLIQLTHLDGRTAEALTLHAAFHARLRAMDSEPTPAFLQLGTALERDAAGASGRRTPSSAALFTPDLTGRGHALAELEAVWRGVRAGTPATVLVEGEAGIGKSRFCGEFLRRIASEPLGATILRARGYESAPHGTLAAIAELVTTLVAAPGASGASPAALGEIAILAPAIRERFPSLPEPTGLSHGLEDALVELLSAVSAEAPVVLYFDDLPSADSATQQVLMSVSERIATAVLFLVTARTGEDRTSAYVELATRAGVRRLKLQPLTLGDIEVLLGSMLELAPSARNHLAHRLHAETGGNPFYIIELTAALVDDGLLLPTDAGAWRLEPSETGRPIPLPATIREVVGRRLDRLGLDSRRAVEGAAVLGRAFDPAMVPLVVGVAPATLAGALEELIARRIVRECTGAPGSYEFTHEIMHRVAYDLLPAPRREALHRAAALAYQPRASEDPGAARAFAYHQAQAGLSGGLGRPRSTRRQILLGALAAVVALAVVGAGLLRKQRVSWDPRRVEVAPFENQTGDSSLDAVGRMAADWINLGLAQTRLVATSGGAGHSPRAATLVRGRFYADGDSLRFRAEALDARSGQILVVLDPVAGPRSKPMDAIERVRQRVTAALATHLNPRLSDWTSAASKPTTFEAYQEYALGVELFLQLEYRAAISHYTRAAHLDPDFSLAQLDAALAHMNLGEFREADSIGQLVGQKSERLAPFDRYWLRWMQAHLRGNHAAALQAVRQAASLTAGSEAWYQVGYEARALNRPREAIEALRRLDPAKAGEQGWYRYWNQFTTAHHLLGEHREELAAGRAGRRQYPDILPTLAYEVRALAALGQTDSVPQRLDEALSLPPYDGWNPGTLLQTAAEELEAHGHTEAARDARHRLNTWLESRPAEERASESHRLALGRLLYLDGMLPEARALFLDLGAEHPDSVSYAGYLGVLAARQKDEAEAERIAGWLAALHQPYQEGYPALWQARIEARLGRADQALDRLGEAFARGRQSDLWLHTDIDLASLRGHPRYRALVRPKD